MKRNAKWYGPDARKLLSELRQREAVRSHWRNTSALDILTDVNAALAAIYETAAQPAPQQFLVSYAGYMVLTGHVYVKLGRRGGKWI
jgi:hypothetical protein